MLRIVLVLLFFIALPLAAQEGDYAKITVAKPTFEYGSVTEGSKVSHEFEFKNTGTGDLLIEKAVPACGCTVSEVAPALTKPGQKGVVKVVFDTTGFSGKKSKTVRLYTNDPRKRYLTLTLKGSVLTDVAVEPKQVFLSDVIKDGEFMRDASQSVKVRIQNDSSASIKNASTFSEYLSVQQTAGNAQDATFTVSVLPTAPIGEIRDTITIALEGSKRNAISVPVYVNVAGVLQPSQSVVSFGVLSGEDEQRRSVKIYNKGAQRASVSEIKTTNDALTTKLVEINPGKEFVLHIDLDPKKVVADLKATVSIQMKEASIPTLPISVVGILPPQ